MKLLFAIVQNEDSKKLIRALNDEGLPVTKISTTGGFLQGGNTTIMMGIPEELIESALEIIKRESKTRKHYTISPQASLPGYVSANATPVEILVGGAVVFITEVWRYEHY